MASLFSVELEEIRLLDAGAGKGALTAAFVRYQCGREKKPKRIAVTAYELDAAVVGDLERTLNECQIECARAGIRFSFSILNEDFIAAAASCLRTDLFSEPVVNFNASIVNPPYRKLSSDSASRRWLRSVGIETTNYYTAFVALITKLLDRGGEVVAITPRSFCNGPYFKSFRAELLGSISVRRLHLFDSRSAAFGKDGVLQENVILHGIKGESQAEEVILSRSSGRVDGELIERRVRFSEVVPPDDPERFIHLDINDRQQKIRTTIARLRTSLSDLEVSVSTGRVVDFRAKEFLRSEPGPNTVPLIYPSHFEAGLVVWPKAKSRKPNALLVDDKTRALLVPRGVYVLVKRFSSKEERRRIVACLYDPTTIPANEVAFENHLNFFHCQGEGMPLLLARGLAAFLNSTLVDSYFRQFSGHTQVNANDLRKLKYPLYSDLERIGRDVPRLVSQLELDQLLETSLFR
jgi:adenine-specific DNA-methyltransferase